MVRSRVTPRTAARSRPRGPALAVAAVASVGLAACSSGGAVAIGGGTPAAPVASASPAVPAASSSADPMTGGPGAPASSTGSATASRCHPDQLTLRAVRQAQHEADTMHLLLTLTNTSGSACWLRGYPGVDVVGGGGQRYSLPRLKDVMHPLVTVTLAGHGQAHTTIDFVPPTAGERRGWIPARILLTAPDTMQQISTRWPVTDGILPVDQVDGQELTGVYPLRPGPGDPGQPPDLQ